MTAIASSDNETSSEVFIRLVMNNREAGRPVHALTRLVNLLGSAPHADVVLDSSGVGEVHTVIVRFCGGAYVCDLGAPGGTTVNGRRVRWARLTTGDEIAIGPFGLRAEVFDTGDAVQEERPVFCLRNEQTIGSVTSIDPVLVIGSDPGCDVLLDDDAIAPRHCAVIWTQDGPCLRDLQENYPTRLNGRRAHSGRLLDGDSIGVGPYELLFETDAMLPASPGDRAGRLEVVGGGDPDRVVAGRFPADRLRGLEGLWAGIADQARSLIADGRRRTATETGASGSGGRENGPPASSGHESDDPTRRVASASQDTKENAMVNETSAGDRNTAPDQAALDQIFSEQARRLEEKAEALRARVAAAQSALDARARKYRAGLDQERRHLKARQIDLQRQAKALRDAALKGRRASEAEMSAFAGMERGLIGVEEAWGGSGLEFLASGRLDDAPTPELEAAPSAEPDTHSNEVVFDGSTAREKLDQRVSELVELAKRERGEIDQGEAKIEMLRLETERLRASVARRAEKLEGRKTTLEERFRALERARQALRTEREPLVARLRKLDAEEASIQARIAEGERIRRDLAKEAEVLTQARERLKARQIELFARLEEERKRVQSRQVAMQSKAAELEQVLHGRLRDIEVELSARQTGLGLRSDDLSSEGNIDETAPDDDPAGTDLAGPIRGAAEQLAALNRIESQAMSGEARLDALQEKIEALGTTTLTHPVESDRLDASAVLEDGSDTTAGRNQSASVGGSGEAGVTQDR